MVSNTNSTLNATKNNPMARNCPSEYRQGVHGFPVSGLKNNNDRITTDFTLPLRRKTYRVAADGACMYRAYLAAKLNDRHWLLSGGADSIRNQLELQGDRARIIKGIQTALTLLLRKSDPNVMPDDGLLLEHIIINSQMSPRVHELLSELVSSNFAEDLYRNTIGKGDFSLWNTKAVEEKIYLFAKIRREDVALFIGLPEALTNLMSEQIIQNLEIPININLPVHLRAEGLHYNLVAPAGFFVKSSTATTFIQRLQRRWGEQIGEKAEVFYDARTENFYDARDSNEVDFKKDKPKGYDDFVRKVAGFDFSEESKNEPSKPYISPKQAKEAAAHLVVKGLDVHAQYHAVTKGLNLSPHTNPNARSVSSRLWQAAAQATEFFSAISSEPVSPPHKLGKQTQSATEDGSTESLSSPLPADVISQISSKEAPLKEKTPTQVSRMVTEYEDPELTIERDESGLPEMVQSFDPPASSPLQKTSSLVSSSSGLFGNVMGVISAALIVQTKSWAGRILGIFGLLSIQATKAESASISEKSPSIAPFPLNSTIQASTSTLTNATLFQQWDLDVDKIKHIQINDYSVQEQKTLGILMLAYTLYLAKHGVLPSSERGKRHVLDDKAQVPLQHRAEHFAASGGFDDEVHLATFVQSLTRRKRSTGEDKIITDAATLSEAKLLGTGLTPEEIQSLFGSHGPLPLHAEDILHRYFPSAKSTDTQKISAVASECNLGTILTNTSPILGVEGAIEDLGHQIEELIASKSWTAEQRLQFRIEALREFRGKYDHLSHAGKVWFGFKKAYAGGVPALMFLGRLENDAINNRSAASMSVAEIEGLKTAAEAWQIAVSLVPGVAGAGALIDLVDAIKEGKQDICRYISDIIIAGGSFVGLSEGAGKELTFDEIENKNLLSEESKEWIKTKVGEIDKSIKEGEIKDINDLINKGEDLALQKYLIVQHDGGRYISISSGAGEHIYSLVEQNGKPTLHPIITSDPAAPTLVFSSDKQHLINEKVNKPRTHSEMKEILKETLEKHERAKQLYQHQSDAHQNVHKRIELLEAKLQKLKNEKSQAEAHDDPLTVNRKQSRIEKAEKEITRLESNRHEISEVMKKLKDSQEKAEIHYLMAKYDHQGSMSTLSEDLQIEMNLKEIIKTGVKKAEKEWRWTQSMANVEHQKYELNLQKSPSEIKMAQFRSSKEDLRSKQEEYIQSIIEHKQAREHLREAKNNKKHSQRTKQAQEHSDLQSKAQAKAQEALQELLNKRRGDAETGQPLYSLVKSSGEEGMTVIRERGDQHDIYTLQKIQHEDRYTLYCEDPNAPKDFRHYVINDNHQIEEAGLKGGAGGDEEVAGPSSAQSESQPEIAIENLTQEKIEQFRQTNYYKQIRKMKLILKQIEEVDKELLDNAGRITKIQHEIDLLKSQLSTDVTLAENQRLLKVELQLIDIKDALSQKRISIFKTHEIPSVYYVKEIRRHAGIQMRKDQVARQNELKSQPDLKRLKDNVTKKQRDIAKRKREFAAVNQQKIDLENKLVNSQVSADKERVQRELAHKIKLKDKVSALLNDAYNEHSKAQEEYNNKKTEFGLLTDDDLKLQQQMIEMIVDKDILGDPSALPEAEPAQSEPAQSEPAQSEPAQSKPAQSEPAQAEVPRLEFSRVGSAYLEDGSMQLPFSELAPLDGEVHYFLEYKSHRYSLELSRLRKLKRNARLFTKLKNRQQELLTQIEDAEKCGNTCSSASIIKKLEKVNAKIVVEENINVEFEILRNISDELAVKMRLLKNEYNKYASNCDGIFLAEIALKKDRYIQSRHRIDGRKTAIELIWAKEVTLLKETYFGDNDIQKVIQYLIKKVEEEAKKQVKSDIEKKIKMEDVVFRSGAVERVPEVEGELVALPESEVEAESGPRIEDVSIDQADESPLGEAGLPMKEEVADVDIASSSGDAKEGRKKRVHSSSEGEGSESGNKVPKMEETEALEAGPEAPELKRLLMGQIKNLKKIRKEIRREKTGLELHLAQWGADYKNGKVLLSVFEENVGILMEKIRLLEGRKLTVENEIVTLNNQLDTAKKRAIEMALKPAAEVEVKLN